MVVAILDQDRLPSCVSVSFQGTTEDAESLGARLARLAADTDYGGLVFQLDSARGSSHGRNQALAALPDSVEWVWTPNDTSRPPIDWVSVLGQHLATLEESVGAAAMDYRVAGRLRRAVSDAPALSGWSLWKAIEPALVWRRSAVADLGGFDVGIGTGAAGWAQSGECTDLLARLAGAGYAVVTVPLAVDGRPQHPGGGAHGAGLRKEFFYGVGFGCVARRHFPLARGCAAAVSPLVKLVARRPLEGEPLTGSMALTAFAGRATGLLLGERSVRVRMPGRHWTQP